MKPVVGLLGALFAGTLIAACAGESSDPAAEGIDGKADEFGQGPCGTCRQSYSRCGADALLCWIEFEECLEEAGLVDCPIPAPSMETCVETFRAEEAAGEPDPAWNLEICLCGVCLHEESACSERAGGEACPLVFVDCKERGVARLEEVRPDLDDGLQYCQLLMEEEPEELPGDDSACDLCSSEHEDCLDSDFDPGDCDDAFARCSEYHGCDGEPLMEEEPEELPGDDSACDLCSSEHEDCLDSDLDPGDCDDAFARCSEYHGCDGEPPVPS